MKFFLLTVLTTFFISSVKGQALGICLMKNERNKSIDQNNYSAYKIEQSLFKSYNTCGLLTHGESSSNSFKTCFWYYTPLVQGLNLRSNEIRLNKHLDVVYGIRKNIEIAHYVTYSVLGDSMIADTPKVIKEKKRDFLSLHGQSLSEVVLGNNQYSSQTLPASYLRQQVSLNATFGFVPLDVHFLVTTEKNGISNSINNLGLTVDFDRLIANILASSRRKQLGYDYDKNGYTNFDTSFDIKTFNLNKAIKQHHYSLDSLKRIVGDKDYIRQFNQDSLTLLKADTLNLTYEQKISQSRYQKHRKVIATKDSIEHKINTLEIEKRKNRVSNYLRSQQRLTKKDLNNAGINALGGLLINSVKKVNIGNFTPEYTDLTLSQTNLTGFGVELGVGYLYGAFAAGIQRNTSNQQSFYKLNNHVLAGRIGIGRPDKLLLSLNLVKGQRNGSIPFDTMRLAVGQNLVTSVALQYSYKQKLTTVFEYAKSVSNYNQSEKAPFSEWNKPANFGANAFSFKLIGNYKNNGSYQAEVRYTEPFYTSLGAPNLRRDNLRSDFKVRHQIIKNKITANLGILHDRDNLSQTKNVTSTQIRVTAGLRIKLNRLPQILFTYSPIRQRLNTRGDVTWYKASINLFMVSLNHTKRLKIGSNSTNVTYNLYSSKVTKETNNRSRRDHLMINNATYHKKYNLTFTQTLAGYTTFHNDSSMGVSAGLAASKNLPDKDATFGFGWRYQWDKDIETRNILFIELAKSLKYQIQTSLRVEQSFIQSSWNNSNNTQQLFLTLIKKF